MVLSKPSRAGSLESNDIYIMLIPNEEGLELDIDSKVMKQFGKRIKEVILSCLKEHNVTACKVIAKDSGALDFTIQARIATAIERGR